MMTDWRWVSVVEGVCGGRRAVGRTPSACRSVSEVGVTRDVLQTSEIVAVRAIVNDHNRSVRRTLFFTYFLDSDLMLMSSLSRTQGYLSFGIRTMGTHGSECGHFRYTGRGRQLLSSAQRQYCNCSF